MAKTKEPITDLWGAPTTHKKDEWPTTTTPTRRAKTEFENHANSFDLVNSRHAGRHAVDLDKNSQANKRVAIEFDEPLNIECSKEQEVEHNKKRLGDYHKAKKRYDRNLDKIQKIAGDQPSALSFMEEAEQITRFDNCADFLLVYVADGACSMDFVSAYLHYRFFDEIQAFLDYQYDESQHSSYPKSHQEIETLVSSFSNTAQAIREEFIGEDDTIVLHARTLDEAVMKTTLYFDKETPLVVRVTPAGLLRELQTARRLYAQGRRVRLKRADGVTEAALRDQDRGLFEEYVVLNNMLNRVRQSELTLTLDRGETVTSKDFETAPFVDDTAPLHQRHYMFTQLSPAAQERVSEAVKQFAQANGDQSLVQDFYQEIAQVDADTITARESFLSAGEPEAERRPRHRREEPRLIDDPYEEPLDVFADNDDDIYRCTPMGLELFREGKYLEPIDTDDWLTINVNDKYNRTWDKIGTIRCVGEYEGYFCINDKPSGVESGFLGIEINEYFVDFLKHAVELAPDEDDQTVSVFFNGIESPADFIKFIKLLGGDNFINVPPNMVDEAFIHFLHMTVGLSEETTKASVRKFILSIETPDQWNEEVKKLGREENPLLGLVSEFLTQAKERLSSKVSDFLRTVAYSIHPISKKVEGFINPDIRALYDDFKLDYNFTRYMFKLDFERKNRKGQAAPPDGRLAGTSAIQRYVKQGMPESFAVAQYRKYKQEHGGNYGEQNAGAILEAIPTDYARAIFGENVQGLSLTLSTYKDGKLKIVPRCVWEESGQLEALENRLKGCVGHRYEGYLVKNPEKEDHEIYQSMRIKRLGWWLAVFLVQGDRDAYGSHGQNKVLIKRGDADPTLFAIDFGHAYEGRNPLLQKTKRTGLLWLSSSTKTIETNLTFSHNQPSDFKKKHKNMTIVEDRPLSEKMVGLYAVLLTLTNAEIHDIFQGEEDQIYAAMEVYKGDSAIEAFLNNVQRGSLTGIFDAYIRELESMAQDDCYPPEHQKHFERYIGDVEAAKEIAFEDAKFLLKLMKDRMKLKPQEIELLDFLEKEFSETSQYSPDGSVRLNYPRITGPRVQFEMQKYSYDVTRLTVDISRLRDEDSKTGMLVKLMKFLTGTDPETGQYVAPRVIQEGDIITISFLPEDFQCFVDMVSDLCETQNDQFHDAVGVKINESDEQLRNDIEYINEILAAFLESTGRGSSRRRTDLSVPAGGKGLYDKLVKELTHIYNEIDNSLYKTTAEFYYNLVEALKEFYETLPKPSIFEGKLKYMNMKDRRYSSDYQLACNEDDGKYTIPRSDPRVFVQNVLQRVFNMTFDDYDYRKPRATINLLNDLEKSYQNYFIINPTSQDSRDVYNTFHIFRSELDKQNLDFPYSPKDILPVLNTNEVFDEDDDIILDYDDDHFEMAEFDSFASPSVEYDDLHFKSFENIENMVSGLRRKYENDNSIEMSDDVSNAFKKFVRRTMWVFEKVNPEHANEGFAFAQFNLLTELENIYNELKEYEQPTGVSSFQSRGEQQAAQAEKAERQEKEARYIVSNLLDRFFPEDNQAFRGAHQSSSFFQRNTGLLLSKANVANVFKYHQAKLIEKYKEYKEEEYSDAQRESMEL